MTHSCKLEKIEFWKIRYFHYIKYKYHFCNSEHLSQWFVNEERREDPNDKWYFDCTTMKDISSEEYGLYLTDKSLYHYEVDNKSEYMF